MRTAEERLITLLEVHDLHLAPIDSLGDRARLQHHPDTAALKYELDDWFVARLDHLDLPGVDRHEASAAMRALGRIDLVPPLYEWLADEATIEELREYLSVEGGPDGGFDDLVAACQIGMDGIAKLELAQNYWDEMGNGRLDRVHTELHRKLARAVGLREVSRQELPIEALERACMAEKNRAFTADRQRAPRTIRSPQSPRLSREPTTLSTQSLPWRGSASACSA